MEQDTASEQKPKELAPTQKFFQYFQHEVTEIQSRIERLQQWSAGGERSDAVDHCLASIARLSDEVKAASSYLPAYDQRTYGEAIKALSNRLQDVRSTFAPKPKFSFKSGSMFTAKKNESAISLNDAAELTTERRKRGPGNISDFSNESSFATTPAEPHSPALEGNDSARITAAEAADLSRMRQPSFSRDTSIDLSHHDGMHILLPNSASHATSSGTVSMLHRCVLDMWRPTSTGHPFAGLTIKNIKQCLIVCGRVNGAVHLTNISNSIIVVESRQFRMHESRNCDVYLMVSSRPIIEDCSGIRFAPLPERYEKAEHHDLENKWQEVDDFKWLRNEPSPNWRMLEEQERVKDEVWRNVLPGGPKYGTEDILKAAGIAK